MKRSKITLGLTALLLAAVGAFASVSNVQQNLFYRVNQSQPSSCTPITLTTLCEFTEGVCIEPTPDGNRQIYSNSTCTETLKKEAGF